MTNAERLLWSRLRRRQLAGFKFRRQHQISLYTCDFVSLDGSQHVDRKAYDARRDGFLRSAGFRVLRFWNGDVMSQTDGVVETIYAALQCLEMDGRFD